MENRYKEIVLEAEKGITFETFVEREGKLVIRAVTTNIYSEEYINPPVPVGFKHIEGEWNDGYVIEQISSGSQFVWIPVGGLDPDGTLDGEKFVEKFGRRNFPKVKYYDDDEFHNVLKGKLLEQLESVKKYGGFYISRFNISKDSKGRPVSVKGAKPITNVKFEEAKALASNFETGVNVRTHLTYGAEYDSVLAWLIKSGAKTLDEVVRNSSDWGNYVDWDDETRKVMPTGSSEKWCANRIYDLAGNVDEWTQEEAISKGIYRVNIRGGSFQDYGNIFPAGHSNYHDLRNYKYCGFRISLEIV